MNKLNEIVKQCIEQHEGGERFFDAIDEEVRNDQDIMQKLYNMIYDYYNKSPHHNPLIVTSGKFGAVFKNHVRNYCGFIIIAVEGGLRHNEFSGFGAMEQQIETHPIIFVDDSFYAGRTRNKIKEEIERLGSQLIHTFVAYDGSIEKDESVTSIFRYHK